MPFTQFLLNLQPVLFRGRFWHFWQSETDKNYNRLIENFNQSEKFQIRSVFFIDGDRFFAATNKNVGFVCYGINDSLWNYVEYSNALFKNNL